jgi:hypothetical protein
MTIEKIVIFITMFLFISPDPQLFKETIDNKELSFYSSLILDEDTILDEGDYTCNSLNEVNILVVKGAKLKIEPGRKISKIVNSSSRKLLEEENDESFSNSDSYKYGLTANIVAIGKGSQIIINGATIMVDCPFSDAIVALDGARIIIKNTTIITKQKYSKGLVVSYSSFSEISDKTSIKTEGNFSPCIELKTNGEADVTSANLNSIGEGSSLINTIGDVEINLFSSTGNATNSQLVVMLGNSMVAFHDCDFTVSGKGIINTDYYKNDINLKNGGIIIYQNEIYNVDVCDLKIFNSNLYINNKAIPMISCFNVESTIIIDNSKFYFGKIFITANKTESSNIYTKIDITMRNFSFNETKRFICDANSNINCKADQNMMNTIEFNKS